MSRYINKKDFGIFAEPMKCGCLLIIVLSLLAPVIDFLGYYSWLLLLPIIYIYYTAE